MKLLLLLILEVMYATGTVIVKAESINRVLDPCNFANYLCFIDPI